MADNVIERTFEALDDLGVTEYILPFLLVFTVTFAVLQKSKILGDDKRNFNVIFATITGLLFVMPHATGRYPHDANPVLILNAAIPDLSLLMIGVVAVMILIGVFGQEAVLLGVAAPVWVVLFSLGAVAFVFGGAAGWWENGFFNKLVEIFGEDVLAIVIMLLAFGIAVQFIASDPKEKREDIFGFYPGKLYGGGGGGH